MDNRNCKLVGKSEMKIKWGNEYEKVKVNIVEEQKTKEEESFTDIVGGFLKRIQMKAYWEWKY